MAPRERAARWWDQAPNWAREWRRARDAAYRRLRRGRARPGDQWFKAWPVPETPKQAAAVAARFPQLAMMAEALGVPAATVLRVSRTRVRGWYATVYLRSVHWQETRLEALERDGGRCQRCGATERLQVHHITYERLWCEDPDDLVTLCRLCHRQEHES